jgi:hypothetical protein
MLAGSEGLEASMVGRTLDVGSWRSAPTRVRQDVGTRRAMVAPNGCEAGRGARRGGGCIERPDTARN